MVFVFMREYAQPKMSGEMWMYPINLNVTGKLCIVVGGGHVALRKVKSLLNAGADVTVISPELRGDDWFGLVMSIRENGGVLQCMSQPYVKGMLKEMERRPLLVFCAADSPKINAEAAQDANDLGILVNCADDKERCDFQVPSNVHRGNLILSVATSGSSPAFSRLLRKELESLYTEDFSRWIEVMEKLRQELQENSSTDTRQRERFWHELMNEKGQLLLKLIREGKIEIAEEEIRNAFNTLDSFRTES